MAIRDREPIPDFILDAPELGMGEGLFLQGYYDLDSCRSFGLSKGPIPWIAIHQYCQFKGFDYELTEEFMQIIRLVDSELLAEDSERRRLKSPNGGANGK